MKTDTPIRQEALDRFHIRARRYRKEGTKDGLCGICRSPNDIPRKYRAHYEGGHSYGMWQREAA